MKSTRAFTLLELLVVISIITVFTVLTTTGLRYARQRADATKCITNLRMLAAANLTYAADNSGHFVAAQEPANLVRWHGVRTNLHDKFDPTQGPLSPYLGHSRQIKLCPALERVITGTKSFEEGTGGYGYNAVYIGGTPTDPFTPARVSMVSNPTQVIMFTDCAFPKPEGLQEYAYAEPYFWVDYRLRPRGGLSPSVHFRHDGLTHVAWCDGHVSAEKPMQFGELNPYGGDNKKWKIGWFGPSRNNGYWQPE